MNLYIGYKIDCGKCIVFEDEDPNLPFTEINPFFCSELVHKYYENKKNNKETVLKVTETPVAKFITIIEETK